MATVIMVNGKVITGQQIASFQTSAADLQENISVWTNAGTIQLYKGNSNWLNDMFQLEAFRLKSGKVSAFGKSVLAYIKAHAPLVKFNDKNGKFSRSGNKDHRLWNCFTVPGAMEFDEVLGKDVPSIALVKELDDKGQAVKTEAGEFKYVPTYDFSYTFSEFLNLEQAPPVPSTAPLKATTVSGQLKKVLEALENKKFSASAGEVAKLASELADLYALVYTYASQLDGALPALDVDMANRLAASGQKGKSAKAGDKVEGPVSDAKVTLTAKEKRAIAKGKKVQAADADANANIQAERDAKAAEEAPQKAMQAIAETALTMEMADKAKESDGASVQPLKKAS